MRRECRLTRQSSWAGGRRREGALRGATGHRLGRGWDEQVLLVPDEVVLAVDRQLVILPHEDRAHRTRLFAIPAEDAAGLVNLIDRCVARSCLNRSVVLRGLEINCIGRTRY